MSPNLDSTIISRFPRFIFPKETTPSISETTAGLEGLRASNNSVTLGKPPVISPDFADLRGIFTNIFPSSIWSPSLTIRCAPTGKLYDRKILPFLSVIERDGISFLFLDSEITFS